MNILALAAIPVLAFNIAIPGFNKPFPNSAGHWTKGTEKSFLNICKSYKQTKSACQCGLTKISKDYSVIDVVTKLYVPSLVSRHLNPPSKAIFDSCGGKWDSFKKKKI